MELDDEYLEIHNLENCGQIMHTLLDYVHSMKTVN